MASFPGTILAPTVCQYIHDLIDGRNFFDPYGADAMCMRALFAIGAIQIYFRGEKPSEAVSLINDLRGVLRDLDEFALDDARIRSFFEESIRYLETHTAADTLDRTAGEDEELSASVQRIPTMVSKETLRYYKWLARTLQEPGDIVELGSWMGSSTACLAEGLSQNPRREHRRIHAYDSFIWRDWMRTYTEAPELLAANIRAGRLVSALFPRLYGAFSAPDRRASVSIEDQRGANCPSGARMERRTDCDSGDGFRPRPGF